MKTPPSLRRTSPAGLLLNEVGTDGASVTGLGIETADPAAAAARATALLAPPLPQTHGPAEADLLGVTAPDGTAVFFCHTAAEGVIWLADFLPTGATAHTGGPPPRAHDDLSDARRPREIAATRTPRLRGTP